MGVINATAVENEVQALKDIKERVPRYTYFGDDNHAAIDAQICVLVNYMNESQVYEQFEDGPLHTLDAALEAVDWITGECGSLVEDWRTIAE